MVEMYIISTIDARRFQAGCVGTKPEVADIVWKDSPEAQTLLRSVLSSGPHPGSERPRSSELGWQIERDPPFRQPRGYRDPGRLIGQRGDDAAVKMTEELHEVVAARQRDLGTSLRDRDNAEARGTGKPLGVDGFREARRVERGLAHAGIRTGNDSMPRTKLE
jgi:hypothetical protein